MVAMIEKRTNRKVRPRPITSESRGPVVVRLMPLINRMQPSCEHRVGSEQRVSEGERGRVWLIRPWISLSPVYDLSKNEEALSAHVYGKDQTEPPVLFKPVAGSQYPSAATKLPGNGSRPTSLR